MALMKCGECGRDVSDKAAACPNCGAPIVATVAAMSGSAVPLVHREAPVVPIEQTGKAYKSQMLGGAVLVCVGILAAIGGSPTAGVLMLLGGVVLYFVGRIGAWWNHG